MNPSEIRRAAAEYIRGRAVLRAAFPELSVEALDALALVIAEDAPVSRVVPAPEVETARPTPPRRAAPKRSPGRTPLEVDVGGTRIPLIDAIIGVFQTKPRGAELTLTDIVDEFNALGWKLLTRNSDWTYPIRERIKSEGVGLLTWRSVRRDGQRYARDVFAMANARNITLSPTSRAAIDASCRAVVQHLSTMN